MDRFSAPPMVFSTARVPKNGAPFSEKSLDCEVFGQAIGFWQWTNFLHSQLAAGKKALHVNLDETGIRMHQVAGKGTVRPHTLWLHFGLHLRTPFLSQKQNFLDPGKTEYSNVSVRAQ